MKKLIKNQVISALTNEETKMIKGGVVEKTITLWPDGGRDALSSVNEICLNRIDKFDNSNEIHANFVRLNSDLFSDRIF